MGPVFDYIVTGGGTAGLVLAARLSENPDTNVLVIEAGEDQTADARVTTPAMWSSLLTTSADWDFRTVPQEGLADREIAVPQGRLLGGSSALNGLMFTTSSQSNINAWESLGNRNWNFATINRCLRKVYTLAQPPQAVAEHLSLQYLQKIKQQANGPLHVSFPDDQSNPWPRAWIETLEALGFPMSGHPFDGKIFGGFINGECVDQVTKQRSYAGNAYLAPARDRSNLTVWTDATVERILLDKLADGETVARGVEYRKGGQSATVGARKEVLLTAGTFNSVKILESSGIGAKDVLRSLGIEVKVENPNVGENLQNHPMCALNYRVKDGIHTLDSLTSGDPATLQAAMDAYAKQTGPFATSNLCTYAQLPFPHINTAAGCETLEGILTSAAQKNTKTAHRFAEAHEAYVRSVLESSNQGSVCLMMFPGYVSSRPDGSRGAPPPDAEGRYITVAALLSHPPSRGSVHLSSASKGTLAIDPCFLSNSLDLEVLSRHIQYVDQHLVAAAPIANKLKHDARMTAGLADIDEVRKFVRKTAVSAHHYTGTCSMMPRDMGGVVDDCLRVYGCSNLRVCDASIIPLTPRTNPQATVYAVAEMAAELIQAGQ